ncbi:ABC transporter permease [Halalkalibacter oceani]|uniref:ABC transporter permease n=1 Tax=Halalkalibacter oceani TaxID=1653776 RepID=UPI003390FF02
MIDMLKKDFLTLIRDRTELLILLFMPILLITILGFALKGVMEGDVAQFEIKAAIVQHDQAEHGIERFHTMLDERDYPENVAAEWKELAAEVSPYQLLTGLFDDHLGGAVELIAMEPDEAGSALTEGEIAAVLTIPENFTFDSLQKMLLNEGDGSQLEITVHEYGSIYAGIFSDIIDRFVNHLNFETALAFAVGERTDFSVEALRPGGIETVTEREPVTSFQYYTIGMAVMFVLYVGATLSSKAFVEKKQHALNRILLSGISVYKYLAGKCISAVVISYIQTVVLFGFSALAFGGYQHTAEFWLGLGLIAFIVSICIGAIAVLLTTIVIRFESDTVSHIFAGGMVSLFAFVGGSFFPTAVLPEFVTAIGGWTPNGAALTAYLQLMQGFAMSELLVPLSRIAGFALLLLIASVMIYPGRSMSS